jgi:hypothetical protein
MFGFPFYARKKHSAQWAGEMGIRPHRAALIGHAISTFPRDAPTPQRLLSAAKKKRKKTHGSYCSGWRLRSALCAGSCIRGARTRSSSSFSAAIVLLRDCVLLAIFASSSLSPLDSARRG